MIAGRKNPHVAENGRLQKNSFICSKYFTDDDFVTNSLDNTPSRARKRTSLLKHRYLKKDVFPSIFPNCPQYLTKKIQVRQSSCTTSKQREAAVIERAKNEEKQDPIWTVSALLQILKTN